MKCGSWGSENSNSVRFCKQCGAVLANRCDLCHASNPIDAKFCSQCGTQLPPVPASAKTLPALVAGTRHLIGERRYLTVLFSDLAGSTAIASKLDLEDW